MYAEWHHEQWVLTWSMRQALKTTLLLIPFSIVYFWESNHSPFHAKRELIKKKNVDILSLEAKPTVQKRESWWYLEKS